MTRLFRLVGQALCNWELTLAAIALLVVIASVSFGVVSRYVTQTSATWAVELASLSFTWVVFLGAAAAFRRNMHVSVDLVVRLLPKRWSAAVSWAMDLLLLVFLPYALYLAISIAIDSIDRPSPVLRISFLYVYGAVVLSFASIFVHHVIHMARRVAGAREQAG